MFSLYIPKKTIPDPDDSFFEEGNIALRAYWLERDAASHHDAAIIRAEASMLTEYAVVGECELQRPVYCEQPQCLDGQGHPLEFPNTTAYALHYEGCHAHFCIECHKPFPSATFLNIHLDESHNILLQMKKERGEKIYACFVENCTKKFISPKMRRLHLVDKHLYPRDFPFDIVWTGTLSFQQRRARQKRQAERYHATMQSTVRHQPLSAATGTAPAPEEEEEEEKSKEESHMDVDMLADEMSKLSIPKTISFGRAKPSIVRTIHHHHQRDPAVAKATDMQIEQQDQNDPKKKRRKRGPKKKRQQQQKQLMETE